MAFESGPAERRATVFLAACIESGLDVLTIAAGERPRDEPRVAAGEVDVVVRREDSGSPARILQVLEVLGVDDGVAQLQELFRHEAGELRPTGLRPRALDRLQDNGITLDPATFAPRRRED